MFDQPAEDHPNRPIDPATRAQEKFDEARGHAELAAVFEGCRKFDAAIRPNLDGDLARDIQRTIGRLEKTKAAESPILPPGAASEAARLLNTPADRGIPANDYHVYRRPGEVMIVRWLEGDMVDAFYERFQAHFEAAIEGFREDDRQALAWRQDARTQEYLAALDKIDAKMSDRYLRQLIRQHNLFVLSTRAADELNISYLADYIMEVPAEEIVGPASVPPDEPSEQDLAWFFKLFALRGMKENVEQMCFFTYLQKSDDTGW